jgi:hypothetical protein
MPATTMIIYGKTVEGQPNALVIDVYDVIKAYGVSEPIHQAMLALLLQPMLWSGDLEELADLSKRLNEQWAGYAKPAETQIIPGVPNQWQICGCRAKPEGGYYNPEDAKPDCPRCGGTGRLSMQLGECTVSKAAPCNVPTEPVYASRAGTVEEEPKARTINKVSGPCWRLAFIQHKDASEKDPCIGYAAAWAERGVDPTIANVYLSQNYTYGAKDAADLCHKRCDMLNANDIMPDSVEQADMSAFRLSFKK